MTYVIVGLAGVAGALLRYALGLWTHNWWSGAFPLATLVTNYAGCLALGWLLQMLSRRPGAHLWIRLGVGTGLIGSFTTFSTFSMETVTLIRDGRWLTAAVYLLASLWGGLAFVWLGERFAMRSKPPDDSSWLTKGGGER